MKGASSASMVEPQEDKKGPGACANVERRVGEELKALVIYIYFFLGIYTVFFNTFKNAVQESEKIFYRMI